MANLSRTQQQSNLLGTLLKSAAGRAKLAASLGPSLRRRRDYMSIARKALMVETLADGALPIYDKEFDHTGQSFTLAFVIAEEGLSPASVVKPIRVTVPTFEIAEMPMIPITQIKERRFDVVQRSLNLGKAEIGATEDGYVFSLFDAVATAAAGATPDDPVLNVDIDVTVADLVQQALTIDVMANAFAQIERFDLSVAYVFCNPRDYKDFRLWDQQNIDRETERKLLKTGVMGFLWGATILQSRKVNFGNVYVLAENEFLGVLPERVPLTVMSADQPALRQIGFSIFEIIGVSIFNPSGVQRIQINRGTSTAASQNISVTQLSGQGVTGGPTGGFTVAN
jgi:hypothetical protein